MGQGFSGIFISSTHRVYRLDYNVYITNQFQTTFDLGRGQKNPLVEVTVSSKEAKSCRISR
jgi:hypothetical protein